MLPARASRLLALALATLTAGCGDAGSGSSPDAATTGDASADGVRTLATCETVIAADAPAFYHRYFTCVTITRQASAVAITTRDLPPHPSYYYGVDDPNFVAFDFTRGADYRPNPNLLTERAITVTIPDAPAPAGVTITAGLIDATAGTSTAEYPLGPIGVALDSVALFTGTAAPGMDIAEERFTFDSHEGHPTADGTYHYHRPTPGPLEVLLATGEVTTSIPGAAEVELYGILCDGTVVLGCTELDGAAPSGLDAQGGHLGDLRAADGTVFFTGRYHTHVCADASRGHAYAPEIQYYGTCAR